jgi:DNA-binding MarR family transcriptional regulator
VRDPACELTPSVGHERAAGTAAALRAGVHRVFFGLKRAFHGILRLGRAPLKDLGLTAARFDMMFAIQRASRHHAIYQALLRGLLGVTDATISRMLRSLEERGYVTREWSRIDRRCRIVRLTEEGLRRIRDARAAMIDSGWADQQAVWAIPKDWDRDPHDYDSFEEIEVLRWQLRKIRRHTDDVATLHYPPKRKRSGPFVPPPIPPTSDQQISWQHPRRREADELEERNRIRDG